MPAPAVVGAISNAIFNAGLIGSVGGAIAAANVIVVGATLGASVGLQAVSAVRAQKAKQARTVGLAGINDQGSRQTIRQALPTARAIYGYGTTGGAMFWYDSVAPYQTIGYLLADHPCGGFVDRIVQGNSVRFDPTTFNAISKPYRDGDTVWLRMSERNGSPDQLIDPLLSERYPALPSSFRQRGVTTAVADFYYGANQTEHQERWGQDYQPLFRLKGKLVYDPRDPTQSRDDSSTWKWSNNPALVIADFLRADFGIDQSAASIDWDSFAEAADVCDEWIGLRDGGVERRFTLDGVITLDSAPIDILSAMMTSCRGRLSRVGGKWSLVCDTGVRIPTLTIDDSWWRAGLEARSELPRAQAVNVVTTKFVAPDRDYQTVDGPVIIDQASIDAIGRQEKPIDLPFTEGSARAQRLGRAYMNDENAGKTINGTIDIRWLRLAPTDIVRVYSRNMPRMNGIYEVEGIVPSNDLATAQISLREYAQNNSEWTPSVDEQPFTLDTQVLEAA